MLPKQHRFHGPAGLRWVYSGGRSAYGRYLAIRVREQQDRPLCVAVVVSRKVHKSAVVRNKIRRRVYEAVREVMPPGDGPALVITARDSKLQAIPYTAIRQEIVTLLSKVRGAGNRKSGHAIVKKEET